MLMNGILSIDQIKSCLSLNFINYYIYRQILLTIPKKNNLIYFKSSEKKSLKFFSLLAFLLDFT